MNSITEIWLSNRKRKILKVNDADNTIKVSFSKRVVVSQSLRLSYGRTYTYAQSLNRGLEKADGDYILVIDEGVLFYTGVLQKMLCYLSKHEDAAGVMPHAEFVQGKTNATCSKYGAIAWELTYKGAFYLVSWLCGYCILLKKSALKSVGLLDERFQSKSLAIVDYSLRLRQAGFDLALVEDALVHVPNHAFWFACDFSDRLLISKKWCGIPLAVVDWRE